ncbi:MAG TPA: hypothetical protein VNA15_10885 [Candidatus Angelobacter sp.]|nr:hypothetical protein [Candidatus Angelobacter sp.]
MTLIGDDVLSQVSRWKIDSYEARRDLDERPVSARKTQHNYQLSSREQGAGNLRCGLDGLFFVHAETRRHAVFVIDEKYDELKTVFDKLADGAERSRFQELHNMPFVTYGQSYIGMVSSGFSREERDERLAKKAVG